MTQMLDRPAATLMPIGRYEWERLVRRIVMPPQTKLVALLLATWADPDGSRVRPGMALLASATGRSERTVSEVMRSLARDWGLIEQTSRGGGRGGKGKTADYRLTIPTDLLDRHVLLEPDGRDSPEVQPSGHSEFSPEAQSSDQTGPQDESPEVQASDHSPLEPVDNSVSPEVLSSGQSNGQGPIDRKSDAVTDRLTGSFRRLTGSSALPTTTHVTNHLTRPTPESPTNATTDRAPDERTSRNGLGGGGDEAARRPTLDEILPLARSSEPDEPSGSKCDRHPLMAGGARDDGQPACPLCRRLPREPP